MENNSINAPDPSREGEVLSYEKPLPAGLPDGSVRFVIDRYTKRIDPRQRFPRTCCYCLCDTDELWNVWLPILSIPLCPKCQKFWRRRLWIASGIIFSTLSVPALLAGMALRLPLLGYSGIFSGVWFFTLIFTLMASGHIAPAVATFEPVPRWPQLMWRKPERVTIRFRNKNYAKMVQEWNTVRTMPPKPIVIPRQMSPRNRKRHNP